MLAWRSQNPLCDAPSRTRTRLRNNSTERASWQGLGTRAVPLHAGRAGSGTAMADRPPVRKTLCTNDSFSRARLRSPGSQSWNMKRNTGLFRTRPSTCCYGAADPWLNSVSIMARGPRFRFASTVSSTPGAPRKMAAATRARQCVHDLEKQKAASAAGRRPTHSTEPGPDPRTT